MSLKTYAGIALMSAGLFLGGCAGIAYKGDLENRLKEERIIKNHAPDEYAVLISGSKEERFRYSLAMAHLDFLRSGFKRKNIYILDRKSLEKKIYPADDTASVKKIAKLFSHLSRKIDNEDLLFVYIDSHGRRVLEGLETEWKSNGWWPAVEEVKSSEISLPGEDLNEATLKEYLDKIDSKITIVLVGSCHSGGFAKRFSKGRYVGISSSQENELSWGRIDGESFGTYFMKAQRNVWEADLNGDGKVSIKESFEYAKNKHFKRTKKEQNPLLESEMDLDNVFINDKRR